MCVELRDIWKPVEVRGWHPVRILGWMVLPGSVGGAGRGASLAAHTLLRYMDTEACTGSRGPPGRGGAGWGGRGCRGIGRPGVPRGGAWAGPSLAGGDARYSGSSADEEHVGVFL